MDEETKEKYKQTRQRLITQWKNTQQRNGEDSADGSPLVDAILKTDTLFALDSLESTITKLDKQNSKLQNTILWLTWVSVAAAVIQIAIAVCHK